jgi:hypothetical protein
VVLLAATLAALAWANIDPAGYAGTWGAMLVIRSGTRELAGSWQGWVNPGLMAFIFLMAWRRAAKFDTGELRERRRLALPAVVAVGGMVAPVAIYLAINFGRSSASGWGAAMCTDTAFALGVLALAGPGVPDRVRTYMLTFALIGDVAGIVIIALAYSGHIDLAALGAGLVLLGVVAVARWRGVRHGTAYLLLGLAAWVAFVKSGVDPVVVGLVMGLLALVYPATRGDLERAFEALVPSAAPPGSGSGGGSGGGPGSGSGSGSGLGSGRGRGRGSGGGSGGRGSGCGSGSGGGAGRGRGSGGSGHGLGGGHGGGSGCGGRGIGGRCGCGTGGGSAGSGRAGSGHAGSGWLGSPGTSPA